MIPEVFPPFMSTFPISFWSVCETGCWTVWKERFLWKISSCVIICSPSCCYWSQMRRFTKHFWSFTAKQSLCDKLISCGVIKVQENPEITNWFEKRWCMVEEVQMAFSSAATVKISALKRVEITAFLISFGSPLHQGCLRWGPQTF